jgi:RNA polymerase sigma-70 factor (ECF subfamily)
MQEEVRAKVEDELKKLAEPYRTTVILRDIEEMSYEQIAEVMETSLGTVKSRLVRGREQLRKRLERYARELGGELGLDNRRQGRRPPRAAAPMSGSEQVEVKS